VLEEVGSGSFGLVKLVEKDKFKYALKELSKNRVMELGKIESVFRERDLLKSLSHPAFPKLY
jgi:serine/threonine protein kinase